MRLTGFFLFSQIITTNFRIVYYSIILVLYYDENVYDCILIIIIKVEILSILFNITLPNTR